MTQSLAALRAMSDAEVVKLYDDAAPNTNVGVAFYADELNRRSQARLARATVALSIVGLLVAVVAVVVAVLKP